MPNIIMPHSGTYEDYLRAQEAYVDSLIDKWEFFLGKGTRKHPLEPIPESLWRSMAIVFENQSIASTRGRMSEQTLTTDVTLPVKYALPIVRDVFPQLIISKIASIQPLPFSSGGTGQVFYLDILREDVTPNTNVTADDSDYAFSEENAVPARIKMTVESETLEATKDILAATWSTEVEEDARGALGLNVGAELVSAAGAEILRELENRMLNEILTGAGAGNVNWAWTVPAGYTTKEWYETLHHAFIDAQALIYNNRFRNADWIICGVNVAGYVFKGADFTPFKRMTPPGPQLSGVRLVGERTGFWDIYMTPYINTNMAIMGTYPRTTIDTGYVFAPYIPLAAMPLMYADFRSVNDATLPGAYENKDKWTRNIRTRNAKMMVVDAMYATITIAA